MSERARTAYIAASRGTLHPYLSTDGAYADMWADENMRRVDGQSCPFSLRGMLHGPVWWLQPALPASAPRHESQRLFAPVDVPPGQMTL
jgi:hypothetical protein